MSRLSDFIGISRKLGSSQLYVQGGGGNTSAKLPKKKIAVKASGCLLREVSANAGYVLMDLAKLVPYYSAPRFLAEGYPQNAVLGGPSLRPSMELAFHTLIPEVFVAHTHPVFINYFLCRRDAGRSLKELFPNETFQYVEYVPPGNPLAQRIFSGLLPDPGGNRVVFLQNHGLIVAGNSGGGVIRKTGLLCQEAMRRALSLDAPKFENPWLAAWHGGFVNRSKPVLDWLERSGGAFFPLFPDAAVFCQNARTVQRASECGKGAFAFVPGLGIFYNCPKRKARAIDEILFANIYLLSAIPEKAQKRLAASETALLGRMESEKYRRRMA